MKLGFGTWQLGGECTFGGRQTGWGNWDKAEAEQAVLLALEKGIRFFDTAPGYGKGASETFLGNIFSKVNLADIKVCTKFGSYENSRGEAYLDFSKEALLGSVEESLKRLKLPKLNIILLHSPPDDFDFGRLDVDVFERLKSDGKIEYYGVSAKSLKGALNVVNSGFGDILESIFNVLDRRAEALLFNREDFKKYQFIARVPLASGFLSEKFLLNPQVEFSETDIRSSISKSDRAWYADSVQKLYFLNELDGEISTSALRYVLHHPQVDFVIPGMRTRMQVERNLQAVDLGDLDFSVKRRIEESLPSTNPNWIF